MKKRVISNQLTMIRSESAGRRSVMAASICCLTLVLFPGCSSTRIKGTPNAAGMTSAPVRNVMIVGIDDRPDFRTPFENDTVAFLKEHGVAANASYPRFTLAEMKGDREQIRQKLLAAKAESVLVVRVTDQSDSAAGAPPVSLGSLDLGAVSESRYNALTMPGGSDNFNVRLAARLYRVSDSIVVWTGMMDTVVKEDYDSVVVLRGVAKTIVDQMAKDKVIP